MKKLISAFIVPFLLLQPAQASKIVLSEVVIQDSLIDSLQYYKASIKQFFPVTIGSGLSLSSGTLSALYSGDVVGPGSSTDNAITRFDGTTGKLVQNSLATIDDSGVLGSNGANLSGNLNLATTTSSRALVTDASKNVVSSSTTATEIGYVSGVTSTIQTQIDGKQATGNYITALTGDITASGPGSAAATLATVNSNVGSFTNASITLNAKGLVTAASNGTAPVTSVTGTANRITVTGTTTPSIDIAATYVGQSSITTLGTIGTGTWNGTAIDATHGGTAQSSWTLGDTLYSSATNTLAKLAGNTTTAKQYLSQTGNGTVSAAPAWATITGADITGAALTKTDDTNVTLTLGGTPTTALLRAASMTLGWTGTLSGTRGGTGVNNGASTLTMGGNVTYAGAFTQTFTATNNTSLTLPITGTLATLAGTEALSNKDLTAGTNTFPTFNQNTTGSAAKWTTARNLAGNSVDGSANVAFANKFIVQGTTDTGLSGAQFLGALATGIVKNTTTTGVLSIAAAGTDYQAPITLTTTGTSGAATFVGNTLNVPNYAAGSGTVTSASVISANGFAGTVATATTTPAITLTTTITGILKGNGTAISAAVSGTDYQVPITLATTGSGGATFSFGTLTIPTNDPVIQRVGNVVSTVTTGTTIIPYDNTIPQNTEGDQYLSQAITPKNTANILVIEAEAQVSYGTTSNSAESCALFQDSTAGALSAGFGFQSVGGATERIHLVYTMTAGTTSATTFKIRCGANAAGTTTFNGASGAQLFGGVNNSYIRITEYLN